MACLLILSHDSRFIAYKKGHSSGETGVNDKALVDFYDTIMTNLKMLLPRTLLAIFFLLFPTDRYSLYKNSLSVKTDFMTMPTTDAPGGYIYLYTVPQYPYILLLSYTCGICYQMLKLSKVTVYYTRCILVVSYLLVESCTFN
jgi:hypothetical protein